MQCIIAGELVTQDRWGRACQPGRPGLGGAGENNRPVGRKPSQLEEREDAVGEAAEPQEGGGDQPGLVR